MQTQQAAFGNQKILSLGWLNFFIILLIPIGLAILVHFFWGQSLVMATQNEQYGIGSLIWPLLMIDTMHVFATLFFLKKHPDIRQKLGRILWVLPLVIVSLSYGIFFFSWHLLLQTTAYIVLFHTVLQQFGWFQKSFDQIIEPFSYLLYKIIFVASSLVPILYWHTGLNGFGRWYFFNNVIVIAVPEFLGPILTYGAVLAILLSLACLAYRRALSAKPLVILAITWFIYYYGIILSGSLLFFILCLVFSHAGGYVLFTYQSILKQTDTPKTAGLFVRSNLLQVMALIGVSIFWIYSLSHILNVSNYLIPLQLVPTTFHLGFDSLIWRKNYRTNLV